MAERRYRKSFNFDLDTVLLREEGFGTSPRDYNDPWERLEAYDLIATELRKLGVEHIQFSGYVSTEKLTNRDALSIVATVSQKLPWLRRVVKENGFLITNVMNVFDATDIARDPEKFEAEPELVIPQHH
jgi:virulence-associated protein VapD